MFKPEPWAKAFIKTTGSSNAEEALEYLRIFCHAALAIPGDLSGRNDADRLGKIIKAALARVSPQTYSTAPAERFLRIMVQKNCFHQYKHIINEIEKIIFKQKGIEEIIVETAAEPDDSFLETALLQAKRITDAKEIKLKLRHIP